MSETEAAGAARCGMRGSIALRLSHRLGLTERPGSRRYSADLVRTTTRFMGLPERETLTTSESKSEAPLAASNDLTAASLP